MKLYRIKDIPVVKFLHSAQYAYLREGHGGKPVWNWPIYRFYSLYYSGEKVQAHEEYVQWYLDQYKKYSNLKSSKGGMKGGSFDRLYHRMKKKSKSEPRLKEAIKKRVDQRFELYEKIRRNGYLQDYSDPIKVYEKEKKYLLFAGHHRVAVLAVLGHQIVPEVIVFKNKLAFTAFRITRKLNLGIN